MRSKTVLISGGDGYIGLHLAHYLNHCNYNVISATRTGDQGVSMDFSKSRDIAALQYHGIDTMIHTVSPNEKLYREDPYYALAENATGIHAALDFCEHNRVKNFIYLSSFHVFGNAEGVLTESSPVAPKNDYGLAHYTAEQTAAMFDRSRRVNTWVIRASNVYGVPKSIQQFKRWNLIPFLFCKEAVDRGEITLQTSGSQQRNFVSVLDLCRTTEWVLREEPLERLFHAYGRETISVWQYALLVQRVALHRFKLSVKINRPDGEMEALEFEFKSEYSYSALQPKEDMEAFVEQMLYQLLVKKG